MIYFQLLEVWLILISRPKTLDDVAAQDHTTKVLRRTLQASNVNHPAPAPNNFGTRK
jgi:hypothetical protein